MPDLFEGPPSITEQITEVERELMQRERVYPRLIANGTLSKVRAESQTRAMRGVLDTLNRVRDLEKS
jgi:hypothetical protein